MVCLKTDAGGIAKRIEQRRALGVHASDDDGDGISKSHCRDLLCRLRSIAAIRGEGHPRRGHREGPGRSGEPGEIAQIGQRRDEQTVDLGIVEPCEQALVATTHIK